MAATVAIAPALKQKFFDNSGVAAAGCKLFTYAAGTSTKQATYTDATGNTANADPIILDALGQANVFLDASLTYKFVLAPATDTDPPTSSIWTMDGITGGVSGTVSAGSVNFAQAATGAVSRPLSNILTQDHAVSVLGFATAADVTAGTGRTSTPDISYAFTLAATRAAALGKPMYLPAGWWKLSNVTLPEGVTLIMDRASEQGATLAIGTIVYVTDTVNPCITYNRGCGVIGGAFYYPNQVTSGTPTAYPPTLQSVTASSVTGFVCEETVFFNSYDICRLGDVAKTQSHGRMTFRGVTGYAIRKGFELHNVLDVVLVDNCIFTWGHYDNIAPTQTIKNWTAKNGTFAECDRVDGLKTIGGIVYGSFVGVRCTTALMDLFTSVGTVWDACPYPLTVESGGYLADATYNGGQLFAFCYGDATFASAAFGASSLGTLGTALTFGGFEFAQAAGSFFDLHGSTIKSLRIDGSKFGPIATATGAAGPYYHVSVNAPSAEVSINDCTFDGNSYASAQSVNIAAADRIEIEGNGWFQCQTPLTIGTITTRGMVQGNASSGTSGTAAVSIATASKTKVMFGINHFDKPSSGAVGAPKFLARVSAAQTINSGVDTTVNFGTSVMDTAGSYDPVACTFTAPFNATYRFTARVTHDATILTTDLWMFKIVTTTREYRRLYRAPVADILTVELTALVEMTAGATAKVTLARQSGAGSWVVQNDANLVEFSGEMVP